MFNFPLTKSSQQRMVARHCEKQYCQYWILQYVWLFLQDFLQTDSLLNLYMLVKSARTVSCELYLEKRVSIALHMVN